MGLVIYDFVMDILRKFQKYAPFTLGIVISLTIAGISSILCSVSLTDEPMILNNIIGRQELISQGLIPLIYAAILFTTLPFKYKFLKIFIKKISNKRTAHPILLSRIIFLIVLFLSVFDFIIRMDWLLERDSYLSIGEHLGKVTALAILAKSMLSVSGILCGICFASAKSTYQKLAAVFIFTITSILLFSGGGKSIAFHLPSFLIAINCISPNKIKNSRKIASAVYSIFWFILFFQIAMANRQSLMHGMVPYFMNFKDLGYFDKLLDFSNLQGFLLFGATVRAASVDYLSGGTVPLSIAISPLSGGASGWTSIAEDLRIAFFIPTPGLAELSAMSNINKLFFILWISACTTIVDFLIFQLRQTPLWISGTVKALLYTLIIGWIQLFCLYNLRSSCRMIYYAVIISFTAYILSLSYNKTRKT